MTDESVSHGKRDVQAVGTAQSHRPDTGDTAAFVSPRFNHDLLVDARDHRVVRERWPTIAHVLIDEELIARFKPFETQAKRLKSLVQWFGTIAIVFMFAALFAAAFELWRSSRLSPAPAPLFADLRVVIETLGILGLLTALLASRYGPFRRRWLQNRFMTELFRQWHFRRLLDPERWYTGSARQRPELGRQRARDLEALVHDLRGAVGQKMGLLIDSRIDPLGDIPQPRLPDDAAARRELLEAYRRLRLEHQVEFAEYKLSADDKTFLGLSHEALVSITDLLAGTALVLALSFAVVQLIQPLGWAPFAAVSLAILGVAIRAWRDGLSLREDQERYEDMRHRLVLLRERWDAASTDEQRFAIAKEIEQTAIEELRSFAHSHLKAQFVF